MINKNYYDLKMFFKKRFILIISIMIGVVVAGVALFLYDLSTTEVTNYNEEYILDEVVRDINSVDELEDEEYEAAIDYLSIGSYSFRIFIENENSSTFTDNNLLKEFLLQESIIEDIEAETGEMFPILPDLALSVFNVRGTSMIQIKVGTGEQEINREIASYYYQLIENNEVEFLENKTAYLVDENIIEFSEENNLEYGEAEDINLSFSESVANNIDGLLIVSILSGIVGFIVGIVIGLLIELLNKKITTIYSFDSNNIDVIYLDRILEKTKNTSESMVMAIQSILNKDNKKRIILSESSLEEFDKYENMNLLEVSNSVLKLEKKIDNVEEIVILVKPYQTTKDWFENELEFMSNLKKDITVYRISAD